MISWNINGICTKLEKENVKRLLLDYDVISVNEVKTDIPVHFPGYITLKSKVVGSADRGGTIVFVKNSIAPLVHDVDTSR